MAVWLSMSMSYVGVGDSANTSKIIVSVDVSWDYPHFNRDGGTLKVTVDGITDTRIVPFNAGETSSGSQNIYSYYWNIAQHDGAAKTVSASATFQATSSTAATPASTTLSLPAIGDSSGGDSGDSGGDDDDDGGNTGGNTGGDGITAPPGNATIVGQLELVGLLADMWATERNYTTGSADIIEADISRNVVAIKFITPKFDGVSSSIDLAVVTGSVDSGVPPTNVSICTDDTSFAEYLKRSNSVSDPNQIASGTIQLTANSICSTNIPTTQLESETTYYVFLWPGTFGNGVVYHSATILESTRSSINVNSASSGGVTPTARAVYYISNGSSFDGYQIYIDNGTRSDKYEMCIDNGVSWDLYG